MLYKIYIYVSPCRAHAKKSKLEKSQKYVLKILHACNEFILLSMIENA